ncbi:MAG TPA: iron uptake system protein EfeO [Acidimicrobiia bacterium]|nr:iron uptake system protein EfeO [Acidimicrobiia bacterium]
MSAPRTFAAAAVAALVTLSMAPAASAKSNEVKVTLTDAGCPKRIRTDAGPSTFKVKNEDATAVSEFEVLSGDRILGERENLVPGLSGEFSLTLKPGTYTTYCPGGDREKGELVVTGTAAAALSPEGEAAVEQYRAYVEDQAAQLVAVTKTFTDAVSSGDVAAAKAAYAPARIPYERIEPVAETFGDLDPRIDAREGDVSKKEWGGFHLLEQALFVDGTTNGVASVATQLQADVEQLQGLIADTQYEPATIANGAVELLNEVSASKITGEEERYSHTDLVDFQANVEGAQAAFDAVKPILVVKNAALAAQIDARFADVSAALAPYGSGATFVSYTDLTKADTKKLSQSIDALAEPLSKVAKKVVSAQGQ